MASKATAETEQRTLEVRTQNEGLFQIDIPAGWKVTFSKVNPQQGGYGEAMALRVYESDDRQRACFTGVISFRDLSIPFRRRVKKSSEQIKAERGPGKRRVEREESTEYEWIDDAGENNGAPF